MRTTVTGTLVLGAMLYPLRQHLRPLAEQVDGFPLSFYPMFRTLRRSTTRITYAVGIDGAGQRHYLSYRLLGDGGFNQVRHQMNREVRAGRGAEHARNLAGRVARDPDHRHIVRVEILRGRFDLDTCLLGRQVRPFEDQPVADAEVTR